MVGKEDKYCLFCHIKTIEKLGHSKTQLVSSATSAYAGTMT
jgi:hypothetical protein